VERKLERQTQTVKQAQRTAQTVREAATQMERTGIIIDTSEDRIKTPGPYETSEQRLVIVTRYKRLLGHGHIRIQFIIKLKMGRYQLL
jgi:hypothetical protein